MLDLIRLGKRIAEVREAKGITQEVLAQELGMLRTALSRLENGQRDISYAEMKRLAEVLAVTPDDLACTNQFESKYAYFRQSSTKQVAEDLEKTNELFEAILGLEHLYHRFGLGERK
jgi:transcriptional regulator with XRE-family HTH domain